MSVILKLLTVAVKPHSPKAVVPATTALPKSPSLSSECLGLVRFIVQGAFISLLFEDCFQVVFMLSDPK